MASSVTSFDEREPAVCAGLVAPAQRRQTARDPHTRRAGNTGRPRTGQGSHPAPRPRTVSGAHPGDVGTVGAVGRTDGADVLTVGSGVVVLGVGALVDGEGAAVAVVAGAVLVGGVVVAGVGAAMTGARAVVAGALVLPWWPGAGSNRRPSDFRTVRIHAGQRAAKTIRAITRTTTGFKQTSAAWPRCRPRRGLTAQWQSPALDTITRTSTTTTATPASACTFPPTSTTAPLTPFATNAPACSPQPLPPTPNGSSANHPNHQRCRPAPPSTHPPTARKPLSKFCSTVPHSG